MKQKYFCLFKVTYRDCHSFFGTDSKSSDKYFTVRDFMINLHSTELNTYYFSSFKYMLF